MTRQWLTALLFTAAWPTVAGADFHGPALPPETALAQALLSHGDALTMTPFSIRETDRSLIISTVATSEHSAVRYQLAYSRATRSFTSLTESPANQHEEREYRYQRDLLAKLAEARLLSVVIEGDAQALRFVDGEQFPLGAFRRPMGRVAGKSAGKRFAKELADALQHGDLSHVSWRIADTPSLQWAVSVLVTAGDEALWLEARVNRQGQIVALESERGEAEGGWEPYADSADLAIALGNGKDLTMTITRGEDGDETLQWTFDGRTVFRFNESLFSSPLGC